MFMVVTSVLSTLKNRTPKDFTIVNFEHPVSKSWLRPCIGELHSNISEFFKNIKKKKFTLFCLAFFRVLDMYSVYHVTS